MKPERNPYPKFIAFLQICCPALFKRVADFSSSADLVEAKLICANNQHEFHALIFSDGRYAQGDRFDVLPEARSVDKSSWDWRWIFAFQAYYQDMPIFPVTFQQRVVALPPQTHALPARFFDELTDEFRKIIDPWVCNSPGQRISDRYLTYIQTHKT